jgi:dihydroorotase
MPSILLQSARVVCASSPWHGQTADVLIEEGRIASIALAGTLQKADKIIEANGYLLTPGWFDLRATLCEPGHEYKDDIATLCRAAAFGGFTDVAVLPTSHPPVQTKESVWFVKQCAQPHGIALHPIAAATKDLAGESLSEMIDLHHAGAVAFANGHGPIADAALLLTALQYLKTINGLLIERPLTPSLAKGGQMHEGIASTMLGMKGMPELAEELAIMRNLELLAYSGGKIHFSCISTARGLALIKEAKSKGLAVTCDVAAHQIAFTDHDLLGFDTNLKADPPFRSAETIEAIWRALADGTIDAIVSDHTPEDEESKCLEFDMAAFGLLGLETAFAALCTHRPSYISVELIAQKLSEGARRVLGLAQLNIEVGEEARLTLVDPNATWTFEHAHIRSRSKNTPFVGHTFTGKVVGTIAGRKAYWTN